MRIKKLRDVPRIRDYQMTVIENEVVERLDKTFPNRNEVAYQVELSALMYSDSRFFFTREEVQKIITRVECRVVMTVIKQRRV